MSGEKVTAILFDLDGTLVDSLPGIEASLRWAVAQCLPGRTLGQIRDFIGPPLPVMLSRFWPDLAPEELAHVVETFRAFYDEEGCQQSLLFAGVAGTLAKLEEHGVVLFVLTNKRAAPTRTILELTEILDRFRAVVSPDSQTPSHSSKPAGALALQQEYALAPEKTIVVGDGVDDAEAALQCGFRFVAAEYGYGRVTERTGRTPFASLKTFSDLERIVL